MKWYRKCVGCKSSGRPGERKMGISHDSSRSTGIWELCPHCNGAGGVLSHQTILPGSMVKMLRNGGQPSPLDNPYSAITRFDTTGVTHVREDSTALVISQRLDDIEKSPRAEDLWQGHDTLCMHDKYGLCWLPSESMEVIG